MTRLLSRTFPSVKLRDCNFKAPDFKKSQTQVPISSSSSQQSQENSKTPKSKSWSVYLILSTTEPIKTYVGITTDFARRLKQHNGEIRGGAKASSAGRPWLCACIITGFTCLSQASSFESKWKIFSRKLPRRKKDEEMSQSDALLQHRRRALEKVEESLECSHLETDWKI
ncbi:GIY-YIG endonuclease [Arabidopsis thaliana x Arabidopsis arenosa]|uniref:GIY-YIG endonuclease n=1 Tax=Arabidopsis thaliana x Arabidopsis arenosa TaxID=1240361 RepID=A0A8T1XEK0_9BRAS|nr:GIY-YIG endonuclease [Arabidopsis thaliana x Arabidopsis arenosa]KAG7532956.1 GIY-YIG endonuclease [Arabidopsis thaliana x Arabidopsis arenosa]KAG7532957.1 GIY-YIG endonuclease [Arabidopsis thaliana x Arabidopsis arenosa]